MTVDQIANKVAWFFQQNRSSFLDAANDDMIISAMNWARLDAERVHDFIMQQGQASMSVSPTTGGDITQAFVLSGDTVSTQVADVKSVTGAYLQDSNQATMFWPLVVQPKKLLNIMAKEISYRYRGVPNSFSNWDVPLVRYPDDTRNWASYRPYTVYWEGRFLKLDPRPNTAQTVRLDCNTWMRGYYPDTTVLVLTSSTASPTVTVTAVPVELVIGSVLLGQSVTNIVGTTITLGGNASDTIIISTSKSVSNGTWTDFMTTRASDYLLYGAIVNINYQQTRFIGGQEGRLSPPEKMRDKSITTLFEWDNFMWEQAFQPRLIAQ